MRGETSRLRLGRKVMLLSGARRDHPRPNIGRHLLSKMAQPKLFSRFGACGLTAAIRVAGCRDARTFNVLRPVVPGLDQAQRLRRFPATPYPVTTIRQVAQRSTDFLAADCGDQGYLSFE